MSLAVRAHVILHWMRVKTKIFIEKAIEDIVLGFAGHNEFAIITRIFTKNTR